MPLGDQLSTEAQGQEPVTTITRFENWRKLENIECVRQTEHMLTLTEATRHGFEQIDEAHQRQPDSEFYQNPRLDNF